jgi:hypothetical protein
MDKNSAEILREIEADLASLKEKVRVLEEQVAEYKELAAAEEAAAIEEPVASEVDFTDMEIGVADLPEEPAPVEEEKVEEPELPAETEVDDLPAAEPLAEDIPGPEPVIEDLPEPAPEPVPEHEPVAEPMPEPAPVSVPKVDTERMQWRLDKPGQSVKNIRSGISLYDRALFIGTLFKEDYALYDTTIGKLNAMTGLDEAVDYLLANFPDWNLKSDIVYNFIMAIRKKLG